MTLTAIEGYAGPGGWSHGLWLARPEIVSVGVEFDAAACETARAAGHHRVHADMTEVRHTIFDLFDSDYQHHSPPCQGFSLAGKGLGRLDGVRLLAAIKRMVGVTDVAQLLAIMSDFDLAARDPKSVLTLEPLVWILLGQPTYVTLEQVPTVLPLWEAMAEVLRSWGYDIWTGVLNAEQYGVPQSRRRAILIGRRDGQPARPPQPTHSKYHNRTPDRLDPGVKKWVSMEEALGWGMDARPSMTITGGGANTGGWSLGKGARESMEREREAGRWALRSGNQDHAAVRDQDQPAATIRFGQRINTVEWEQRSNYNHGNTSERTRRALDEPSTTLTGRPPQWALASGTRPNAAVRDSDQPAFTLAPGHDSASYVVVPPGTKAEDVAEYKRLMAERVNNQSGGDFDILGMVRQPATGIAGRGMVPFRGANANRMNGSTKSRNDGFRISVEEAGVLQSFPWYYPWSGNKSKRYEQVGNAVPPLLAAAVVDSLLP